MVFEHIEKLKQEYTDKFVIVDDSRPELRRFGGMTGTVRTVNMSGRALVEFDANANIGWYDIDVDYLKVIDQPLPKPEAKPAAKKEAKPAAKSVAEKAAPAAKPKAAASQPAAGGMSVAEMMAAARGEKGGTATAPAKPATAKAPAAAKDPKAMSVAEMMAAARGEKSGAAAAPAKPAAAKAPAAAVAKDPKAMSVADMLAAARGEKAGGGTAAVATPSIEEDPQASIRRALEAARKPKSGEVESEPAEPEPVEAAPTVKAPAAPSASGGRRNDITATDEQVAYCRQTDGGK